MPAAFILCHNNHLLRQVQDLSSRSSCCKNRNPLKEAKVKEGFTRRLQRNITELSGGKCNLCVDCASSLEPQALCSLIHVCRTHCGWPSSSLSLQSVWPSCLLLQSLSVQMPLDADSSLVPISTPANCLACWRGIGTNQTWPPEPIPSIGPMVGVAADVSRGEIPWL